MAFLGTTPGWQLRQIAAGEAARSLPWSEVCGLWQPAQSPVFAGMWTNFLLSLSPNSVWQSRHTLPAAPGFNRNLFCACATEPASDGSSARTSASALSRMPGPASRNVTCVARPRAEGHVEIGLEELQILRGVRVVALSAVHGRRLDVQVGLAERRARRVVAFEARWLNRLDQHSILS